MPIAPALDFNFGDAIRTEVKKEVDLLRKDMERDRQQRIQLEQQVNTLRQAVCTQSDVLRLLEASRYNAEGGSAGDQVSPGPSSSHRELDQGMQEVITENLVGVYNKYCDRQKTGLAGKDFTKICLDALLLDRADADLIFSQVMGTQRRMDFEHFELALERVAEKTQPGIQKKQAVLNLRRQLGRLPGPNLNGTTIPDDVRLHDDQTTYTGIFSQTASQAASVPASPSRRHDRHEVYWRNNLRSDQGQRLAKSESLVDEKQGPKMGRSDSIVNMQTQDTRSSTAGEGQKTLTRSHGGSQEGSPEATPKGRARRAESPKGQQRASASGMDPSLSTFAERRARFEEARTPPEMAEVMQLARDIDQKVGTVLQDLDQRIEAVKAYSDRVASAAVGTSAEHAKALFGQLSQRMEMASSRQEEGITILKAAHDTTSALEQKIGSLRMEVDQLQRDWNSKQGDTPPKRVVPPVPHYAPE